MEVVSKKFEESLGVESALGSVMRELESADCTRSASGFGYTSACSVLNKLAESVKSAELRFNQAVLGDDILVVFDENPLLMKLALQISCESEYDDAGNYFGCCSSSVDCEWADSGEEGCGGSDDDVQGFFDDIDLSGRYSALGGDGFGEESITVSRSTVAPFLEELNRGNSVSGFAVWGAISSAS